MFRGRINRTTYWSLAVFLAAAYVAINLVSPKRVPVSEFLILIVCVPRLHDIGYSGWLAVVPVAIQVGGGLIAFALLPRDVASIVLAAFTLLMMGLVVWLGTIPGQAGQNRFGEEPRPGLGLRNARN